MPRPYCEQCRPRDTPAGTVFPIPLALHPTTRSSGTVAAQIAHPFEEHQPPLLRATLLYDTNRAIIILVAHHAIADGLSLTFLLGDVLRALSGQTLTLSQESAAVERLVERRYGPMLAQSSVPDRAIPQVPAVRRHPKEIRHADGTAPHVDVLRLPPEMTLALRDRARVEGTTVQSALAACLATATTQLAPGFCQEPMRIVSPIDLRRRLLDGSDHLGMCTNAVVLVDDGPRDAGLWARARNMSRAFSSIQSPDVLAGMVLGIGGMLADVNAPDKARALFVDQFANEGAVTNLGVVNLPRQYGPLRLESVWGPSVCMGLHRGAGDRCSHLQ
jgi:NRPS condensation-like uncharacterized protein